jgi:hypothetical protein
MAKIDLGSVVGEVDQETIMEFTPPDTYTAPSTGDKINIIFGKITKGLSNLFSGKIDKANIVNNFTVTDPSLGLIPNAATVKVLKDSQDNINTALTTSTSTCALPSGFTANRNKCLKNNKTITIVFSGSWLTPQPSGGLVAVVPTNYRINFMDEILVKTVGGTLYINKNGNIYFYTDSGNDFTVVYHSVITYVNE